MLIQSKVVHIPAIAWLLSLLQPQFSLSEFTAPDFWVWPWKLGQLLTQQLRNTWKYSSKSRLRAWQDLNICLGSLHSPEYFPPLLLLMKQRMSRTSSSSTTALTTPMNQPCVAKLACTSVTPLVGMKSKRKQHDFIFFSACVCQKGSRKNKRI